MTEEIKDVRYNMVGGMHSVEFTVSYVDEDVRLRIVRGQDDSAAIIGDGRASLMPTGMTGRRWYLNEEMDFPQPARIVFGAGIRPGIRLPTTAWGGPKSATAWAILS